MSEISESNIEKGDVKENYNKNKELSWRRFESISIQRRVMFYLYVIISGVFWSSFSKGHVFDGDLKGFHSESAFSLFLISVTIVFWCLENRNHDLMEYAQKYITKKLQR